MKLPQPASAREATKPQPQIRTSRRVTPGLSSRPTSIAGRWRSSFGGGAVAPTQAAGLLAQALLDLTVGARAEIHLLGRMLSEARGNILPCDAVAPRRGR